MKKPLGCLSELEVTTGILIPPHTIDKAHDGPGGFVLFTGLGRVSLLRRARHENSLLILDAGPTI